MRPNARQFRRYARAVNQQQPQEAASSFDDSVIYLDTPPVVVKEDFGLRWVSVAALQKNSCAPCASIEALVALGRQIEADALRRGWINSHTFAGSARPEFLQPYNPVVAFTLSPVSARKSLPKVEPLRPQSMRDLVVLLAGHIVQKIAPGLAAHLG